LSRARRSILSVVAAALALSLGPAAAHARDAVVTSYDGTRIATSFFPAANLAAGHRAPTVLVGHGWGQSRDTNPDSSSEDLFGSIGVGPLRRAGFNVLTWDARGWGQSGGTIEVDSPDVEARDVQTLTSFVATQPEALLDAPGDPREGMSGVSYGGGIQLVSAAIDSRIDAITPTIAWHSQISSLDKNGAAKGGWGAVLYAAAQGHRYDAHIDSAFASGVATGTISDADLAWFASRGPGDTLLGRIHIPTLLLQGTADTLFTLHEAILNYGILHRNGVPAKMLWFCGGHGICLTGRDPGGLVENAVIAWFRRYLRRDRAVATGPRFQWVSDDGTLRSAADYPLRTGAPLVGTGSGTLPFSPDPGSGGAIAATPAANAINVPIGAPSVAAQVLGEPKLTLAYSGTAAPSSHTIFYAQLVNLSTGVVLGNQVTPVPVALDGQPHVLTLPLEGIAVSASPQSRYELQLTPSSNVYSRQQAAGVITASKIRVELPVADPNAFTVSATGNGANGSACTSRPGRAGKAHRRGRGGGGGRGGAGCARGPR